MTPSALAMSKHPAQLETPRANVPLARRPLPKQYWRIIDWLASKGRSLKKKFVPEARRTLPYTSQRQIAQVTERLRVAQVITWKSFPYRSASVVMRNGPP